MNTRTGKIARLPLHIRNELNTRLQDGQTAETILAWLNPQLNLPTPITPQNISTWRSGGYLDWLRHQDALELVQTLADQAGEIGTEARGPLGDHLGSLLAVELARLTTLLLDQETDPEKRWVRLREINREVSQLRRDDHRALQARISHERWQQEQAEQQAAEQAQREKKLQLTKEAAFWAPMKVSILAESFGGGQAGRHVAAAAIETGSGFPRGTLTNLPENRLPEDNKTTPPSPTTPNDLSRQPVAPKSDAGGSATQVEGGPAAPVDPTKTPENPSKSK